MKIRKWVSVTGSAKSRTQVSSNGPLTSSKFPLNRMQQADRLQSTMQSACSPVLTSTLQPILNKSDYNNLEPK